MPRDLKTILEGMAKDGHFVDISRNPLAQFGTPARRYIGAEILPEQPVTENAFREEGITYRTVVANSGTRYSPVQRKRGELVGAFSVELANSDIGRELTAREYDMLVKVLRTGADMEAVARMIRWSDTVLNRALIETNERYRWQSLVSAVVNLRGDNEYAEDVAYSNPAGHRFNAAAAWSNDATDPFVDIDQAVEVLEGKGFGVSRIITSRTVMSILGGNDKIKNRLGSVTINVGGTLGIAPNRASINAVGRVFNDNELPAPERYDLQYKTQTGSGYFLPRNVMVFVSNTGRDANLDLGDQTRLLPDTLGYMAVGVPAGQANPGRIIRLEAFDDKPPRIDGQAWQTSLPVIQDPEAVVVIGGIS